MDQMIAINKIYNEDCLDGMQNKEFYEIGCKRVEENLSYKNSFSS